MVMTMIKTPRAGFEPATNRLTVDRSTAELPRNDFQETLPLNVVMLQGSQSFA